MKQKQVKTPKKRYFDYAATTPVDARVLTAMEPYFSRSFGNAGSLHSFGQEAIAALDSARIVVARETGISFDGVVFTGSATEANNLAITGVVHFWRAKNLGKTPRIVVSAIEHDSVLSCARFLERAKLVDLVVVPVDRNGIVDCDALQEALTPETILVSVMYGNNEVGTIQPIQKISAILSDFRKKIDSQSYPFFHTDAAQVFGYFSCNLVELGVDLLTLSSQKIYGPKGVGALCLGQRVFCVPTKGQVYLKPAVLPILHGGGQEGGLRSGTENVAGIVGFAAAVEIAVRMRNKEAARLYDLRKYLWKKLHALVPHVRLVGILRSSKISESLPHILSVVVSGEATAQDILTRLDLAGIAASSGSACSARAFSVSHVYTALGFSKDEALRTVRFSFGRETTKKDVDELFAVLKKIFS